MDHRTRTRPRPVAVVAAVSLVVAFLGALAVVPFGAGRPGRAPGWVAVADAQTSAPTVATGSTIDRLAPVPVDPADPAAVQISGLWLATDPGPDPSAVEVVVGFADPAARPDGTWRVSVSIGDPLGTRTRASLVVTAQGETSVVEVGDGALWDDGGTSVATVDEVSRVTIGVPLDGLDPEPSVWAEAETVVEGEVVVATTPSFALLDLLGARPGPSLGVATVAEVLGAGSGEQGTPPPVVAVGDQGLTVAAVGRALELTTTTPVPTEVDATPVVAVVDTIVVGRIGDDGAWRTDRIEVDRATGEVRLLEAGADPAAGPLVAEPGTSTWLVNPPSATAPGAPSTVTFDVEALDGVLGGPVLERSTTSVGVERDLSLDDGRVLAAGGVVGTMDWFDAALVAAAPDPGTPGEIDDASGATAVVVGVLAALVVAAVVAVVVVVVRRRRRRARAERSGPSALPAPSVPTPAAATPAAATSDAPGGAGSALPARGPATEAGSPDPLAALFAEVAELSARVDRLGSPEAGVSETGDPGSTRGDGGGGDDGGGDDGR